MDVDPLMAALVVGLAFVISSPLWLPIAFAAYAIGRGNYGLRTLFIFLAIEAVSLAVAAATFVLCTDKRE